MRKAVTCVFGAGDSGKTGFVIKFLLNTPAACRWIIESDKADYSARLKLRAAHDVLGLEVAIRTGWALWEPSGLFGGDSDGALDFWCRLATAFSGRMEGRKLFILDEAWRYVTPHRFPMELANVVRNGRKCGLESVFLCQEPRQVNETLLAEATEIVCFRLAGMNSLGRLADYGFPDCEALPTLPRGSFVALNRDSGGVIRGKLF